MNIAGMNWRTVLGWALLAAAIVTGWSAWRQRAKPVATVSAETGSDFVLRDFELVALDKQGRESATLRAPEMQRSRADQTLDITTPLFLLPDSQGRHWELRSQTGWVSAKADEVRLRGDVNGISPPASGTPPTTLHTESLDIFPQKNIARSAEKVTMTRPGIIQSGVGFEGNLDTRQFRLLSQVKTTYEPKSAR